MDAYKNLMIQTSLLIHAMKHYVGQATMVIKDVRIKRIPEEHARDGINKHHIVTYMELLVHITFAEIQVDGLQFGATRLTQRNDGKNVVHYKINHHHQERSQPRTMS